MKNYMWLSFVDPDKPEGERFLGVAVVEGDEIIEAVEKSHKLKINPGGEVAAFGPYTEEFVERIRWPINTLMTKDQALSFGQQGKDFL